MAKPELGLKRTCVNCGAKFYDLGRVPAECPKCGTEQPIEQPRLRSGNLADERRLKKAAPLPADGDVDVDPEVTDDDDAEADAAIEEDADDLDDDDDAIGNEIEVETDGDNDEN